ncbi:MAG TPA: hypothetical protein VMA73_24385 [Streptosporangiaceae bacterium]|nr:hypothetical protein [Streptosporangiaceae bacterium]
MPQHDIRTAAQSREAGLAKISALSWRAGAAAVAVAGLLTVALGQHSSARAVPPEHRTQGSIVIPAQPPGQATGTGQVTSGAS